MISIKPTEHLTGITIQGDYDDFYELVDTMYRVFTIDEEDEIDPYHDVKIRLFGICYDIRHAYMGNRDIVLEDNGMNKELMKWHGRMIPTQNVYYSVNLLFPDAIFAALSIPKIYRLSILYYGNCDKGSEEDGDLSSYGYLDYIRDRAIMDVFCVEILQAFREVVGEEEMEKMLGMIKRSDENYENYAIHYIDKCNIELIKTKFEKRKDKLKNITKRIIKKTDGYYKLEAELKEVKKEYNIPIDNLGIPSLRYPKDFEW